MAEAKAPLALKSLEIRALFGKVREQREGVGRKGWCWKSDPGSPLVSTSYPSAETSALGTLGLFPVAAAQGAGWCPVLGITLSPNCKKGTNMHGCNFNLNLDKAAQHLCSPTCRIWSVNTWLFCSSGRKGFACPALLFGETLLLFLSLISEEKETITWSKV